MPSPNGILQAAACPTPAAPRRLVAAALMACLAAALPGGGGVQAAAFSPTLVAVGDPGNTTDGYCFLNNRPGFYRWGFGPVDYTYWLEKYEVTNAQYCEFLNAKAKADTYGLYNTEMGSGTHGGITRAGASGEYV